MKIKKEKRKALKNYILYIFMFIISTIIIMFVFKPIISKAFITIANIALATDGQLANFAENYPEQFVTADVKATFFFKDGNAYIGNALSTVYENAAAQKQGMCLNHTQSSQHSGTNALRVGSVIDIKWDDANRKYYSVNYSATNVENPKKIYDKWEKKDGIEYHYPLAQLICSIYDLQKKSDYYDVTDIEARWHRYKGPFAGAIQNAANDSCIKFARGFNIEYDDIANIEVDADGTSQMRKYAKKIKNYKEITKSNTNAKINKTVLGPFKVSYKGTDLKSISITADGSTINGDIYWKSGNNGYAKFSEGDNISGKTIYVAVKDSSNNYIDFSNYGEVKVNFTQKGISVFDGRIVLLTSPNETVMQETVAFAVISSSAPNHTSHTVGYTILNNGNIIINKIDADTGEAKSGAKYHIFKEFSGGGWLTGSSGSYGVTGDNSALAGSEYSSPITKLPAGTYSIYETTTPANYYVMSEQQTYTGAGAYGGVRVARIKITSKKVKNVKKAGSNENGDNIKSAVNNGIATFAGDNSTLTATIRLPNKLYGSLTINKKDPDTNPNELLDGANFKIKFEGKINGSYTNAWLGYDNNKGQVTYTTENNAYQFETGKSYCGNTAAKGVIKLTKLNQGKYTVYETKTPDNYNIEVQDGYVSTNKRIQIETEKTIQASSKNITFNAKNKKLINISGYVWTDEVPDVKESSGQGDNKYDTSNSKDRKIEGVIVYLRKKEDSSEIAHTKTGTNGEYKFEKVNVHNLNKYYIEFDYSGTTYKEQYIPVEYGAASNQSKALKDTTNPYSDADLKNYAKATTYKYIPNNSEATYGLSGLYKTNLYNKNTYTLTGINLGLRKVQDPEYRIEQDIAYAKIKYGGQKYKYIYGGTGNRKLENTPLVNWEGKVTYSRDIYPSDILGSFAENNKTLTVNVVYRIMIKNTAQYSVKNLYDEVSLNVSSLTESIDSIYELDKTVDSDFDTGISSDFAKWDTPANGKTKYKGEDISLGKGEEKSVYIQFKINNKRFKINNKEYNNPLEAILKGEKPQVNEQADISAYHRYTRTDYGWFDQSLAKENQPHRTPNKDGWAKAYGMIFKLSDEERTISGRVFKDNDANKDDNEFKGNGFKDDGEKDVNNVKVDLLQKDGSTLATRYPKSTPGGSTEYLTSKDGDTYSFIGVTPGKYIIRFTYANGKQMYTTDTGKLMNIEEYKSTIVTLESAKNAHKERLGNGENKLGGEWYKYKNDRGEAIDKYTYSVAVDDLEQRIEINNPEKQRNEINADTPISTITIENTIGNSSNVNTAGKIKVNENSEVIIENAHQFNGFNLGLIENPEPEADLEKVVTNVKLTNAQENVIFNGNPETGKMTGVSDLDSTTNNGSQFTRIEIPSETIYGSTLETTYEIRLTNTSYDNYVETEEKYIGWNYIFGEIGPYSKKVELNVEANDYLHPSVQYVSGSEAEGLSIDKSSEKDKESTFELKYNYKELLVIKLNSIAAKTTKSFNIITSRVLSSEDDDMEIINDIEVTKLTKSVEGKYEKESLELIREPKVPTPAEAKTTITPPTGKDMQSTTIYAIAGVVTLVVLATGVVIIKKKIL